MKARSRLMGSAATMPLRLPFVPGIEARLQIDDAMAIRDIEAGRRVSDETVRRASARLLDRVSSGR